MGYSPLPGVDLADAKAELREMAAEQHRAAYGHVADSRARARALRDLVGNPNGTLVIPAEHAGSARLLAAQMPGTRIHVGVPRRVPRREPVAVAGVNLTALVGLVYSFVTVVGLGMIGLGLVLLATTAVAWLTAHAVIRGRARYRAELRHRQGLAARADAAYAHYLATGEHDIEKDA